MYQTIGFCDFIDAFRIRKDSFSYEGLKVLYEYLEDVYCSESDTGYKLDVIALCCEFTESTIQEALDYYNLKSIEELEEKTTALYVDDETIIYANY